MQTSFRGAVKNFQGLAVLVTVPALMTVARGAGVIGSRYRCYRHRYRHPRMDRNQHQSFQWVGRNRYRLIAGLCRPDVVPRLIEDL